VVGCQGSLVGNKAEDLKMDSTQESDSSMGDRIESLVDILDGEVSIENLDELVQEGLMGRTMTTRNVMDEPPVSKSRVRPRRIGRQRGLRGDDGEASPAPRRSRRGLRGRAPRSRRAPARSSKGDDVTLDATPSKGVSVEPDKPFARPSSSRRRVRQSPRRRSLPREGESPLARYGTIPLRYSEDGKLLKSDSSLDDAIEQQINGILEMEDEYDYPLGGEEGSEELGIQVDDITTEDHQTFWQEGKEIIGYGPSDAGDGDAYYVVETGEEYADMWDAINAHMDATKWFPNVWFISDHGNAHLMVDPRYEESISEK